MLEAEDGVVDFSLTEGDTDALAISNVRIAEVSPVIFAGGEGGGANEFAASADPNNPNSHILDIGGLPKGARVVEAWYAPLHNIGALPSFALIDVKKHNNKQVLLSIAAYPSSKARLRIKITVLIKVMRAE